MVRDTSVRLEKAFVDLEEMVENAAKEGFDGEDVAEKKEFLNAKWSNGGETKFDLS